MSLIIANHSDISPDFIWLNVTDKAKEIWNSGIFSLFWVRNEKINGVLTWVDSLINNEEDLTLAIENGEVYIEVGHLHQSEEILTTD